MNQFRLPLIVRALFLIMLLAGTGAQAAQSEWVYPGSDGKLVYKTTSDGDRIMDFSFAGYMGGGVALPTVAVKQTVSPVAGKDSTAAIQIAIDAVSKLPLTNGFRGAVLLEPGTYLSSRTITIAASGVVLRGSGSGPDGSTIKLTGSPHLAIAIRSGGRRGGGFAGVINTTSTHTTITDAYVPSGAISFNVADTNGFSVGDTIEIQRPVTTAWIQFMHMDDLVRDGRRQTWLRAGTITPTDRTIVAISGKTITLDIPLSDSFDARYLNPPGTRVVKIKPSALIAQCGVENLHVESPPQHINHTEPHFQGLRITGQDCWARDLVFDETMNSVGVSGRRITLEKVTVNRKIAHVGASKPAEFAPNGSQVLVDRCAVNADNVWFSATGGNRPGQWFCSTARSPETAPPSRTCAGRPVCCTTIAASAAVKSRCEIAARWDRATAGRWAGA
jgi:hypothetical protein